MTDFVEIMVGVELETFRQQLKKEIHEEIAPFIREQVRLELSEEIAQLKKVIELLNEQLALQNINMQALREEIDLKNQRIEELTRSIWGNLWNGVKQCQAEIYNFSENIWNSFTGANRGDYSTKL